MIDICGKIPLRRKVAADCQRQSAATVTLKLKGESDAELELAHQVAGCGYAEDVADYTGSRVVGRAVRVRFVGAIEQVEGLDAEFERGILLRER